MTLLRFLLNEPLRRRIRLLQAELELLASRVEHLEQALDSASFPDSTIRHQIEASIGLSISIETTGSVIHGTLVAVHHDALKMLDESGRQVIIPAAKIITIKL